MKKNEKQTLFTGRSAAVVMVICFVAVIAAAGAFAFGGNRGEQENQVATSEQDTAKQTKDDSKETTADDIFLPEEEDQSQSENVGESVTEGTDEQDTAEPDEETETSGAYTSSVWFGEDSILSWPTSGAVITGYSMDRTVFFQTLEQYQYNPAMIIAGELGEPICASAAGIVESIGDTAETGTTVTLDMGNGYQAVYGQLADVPVAVGQYVAAGDVIGSLNEPTKYYSVEGTNLYFQILKDGAPVDPMNYME